MRWGDTTWPATDGPPLVLEHHCGHQLTAQVICAACGEPGQGRNDPADQAA